MSQTTSTSTSTPPDTTRETTFRSYSKQQGDKYAQGRPDYPPSLYKLIINHHIKTGGELNILIDIGCGPGNVARNLQPNFTHVYGFDPSPGMIAAARSNSDNKSIQFEVSTAEDLGAHLLSSSSSSPLVEDGSVDLITAAAAAHWFDMERFWRRAAQVLKPGGSVAIWTTIRTFVHPSTPNATAIQAALDQCIEIDLQAYHAPGNFTVRNRYKDLVLPWTVEQSTGSNSNSSPMPEFDQTTFFRRDWDSAEDPMAYYPSVDMDTLERVASTASPITRWRQAHPEVVGTEKDRVRILRRETERLLHEAGVEKGNERINAYPQGVLLIVKKKN